MLFSCLRRVYLVDIHATLSLDLTETFCVQKQTLARPNIIDCPIHEKRFYSYHGICLLCGRTNDVCYLPKHIYFNTSIVVLLMENVISIRESVVLLRRVGSDEVIRYEPH